MNESGYSDNYTVYHLHSSYSLLDSATRFEDYVDRAVELGMKAICFTEHGHNFGWFKKKKYCDSKGIKFLYGIECYLTETLDEKIRDNYHTILIAKNHDGFVEMNRLITLSSKPEQRYYKWRISFDQFLGISDNVIKISACLASPLWSFKRRLDEAEEDDELRREMYVKLAQHYDYYEIQYHDDEDQVAYNKLLYELSRTFNKPLIAGTDTHSLNKYKANCRIVLKYGKTDGDWGDGENKFDLTFKSRLEAEEMFRKQNALSEDIWMTALDETNRMADSVEPLNIDTSIKYPILYPGQDEEQIMMDRVMRMYHDEVNRGVIPRNNPQYLENIKTEMSVFKKINMVGFMLFMSELMCWARDKHIYTSPCRGSVGGSTVAYITGVIDLDPVKRHTVFSRFANEYRVEVGDIDTDWYEDDRPLIYNYMFERFGNSHCAYILALGTLADAAVIDTIGKAYRILAKQRGEETPYTLDKIAEIKREWQEDQEKTREQYPDIFKYYDGLVGCIVSQSQHPAGVVVAPVDLIDNYSVFLKDDMQILPIDMDEVHDIGLVKYDILGLKNVGIISRTCEYANVDLPTEATINWEDQDVFADMMTSPVGVFQFESSYAFRTLCEYFTNLKRLGRPITIDDMTVCNACIRPSGASYRNELIACKAHKNPSTMIDELLANTNGWLVYQEQTIAFLQQICGLSGGEADNVRRAIGRKQADRLEAAMPGILDGYCKKSDKPREVAEGEAKEFLKIIEDSASYQFGFNHATGYSMLGYLCAYYRYYYPLEFCTAFLNCSKTEEDYNAGLELAKKKGFEVMPPRFRGSTAGFFFDKDNGRIYKSVDSIKYMNDVVANEMYALRDIQYNSFVDLLYDLNEKTSLNSRQLDVLIKVNFFEEFGDVSKLLYVAQRFDELSARKSIRIDQLQSMTIEREDIARFSGKVTSTRIEEIDVDRFITDNNIDPVELEKCHKPDGSWSTKKTIRKLGLSLEDPQLLPYATKIVMGSFSDIDNRGLLRYYEDTCKASPVTLRTRIGWEREYLGYIEYTNPTLSPRIVVALDVDTKYTPRFTAYCLKSGATQVMKVHDKGWRGVTSYKSVPFVDGDVLVLSKCKRKPRRRKVDGQWVEDPSEMEWWVENYRLTVLT